MPVHNGGRYLRQALDDILCQTFADFRLLVVDDASTDDSPNVLREYARRDSRILLTENQVRRGLIGAWRQTVDWAEQAFSPAYFAWYSDHDRVDPGFLETLYGAAKADPGLVCVYPETQCIDADGVPVPLERSRACLQTAGMGVWDRMLESVLRLKGSGDIVYGLMRMDAVQACGVFRDEINPDRLLISELSLHGGIRLVPEAVRHRRLFERRSKKELVSRQLHTLFPDGFVKATPFRSHYSRFLREALTSSDEDRFPRLMHGLLYFVSHLEDLEEPVTAEVPTSQPDVTLDEMLRAFGSQPVFVEWRHYKAIWEESTRDKIAKQKAKDDLKIATLAAKRDRDVARQLGKQGREMLKQLAETETRIAKLTARRDLEIAKLTEALTDLVAPVNGDGPDDDQPAAIAGPTVSPMCVLVLGMHRSGTSMVAGTLHHWGLPMGRKLKGPSGNNERGFFEDLAVKQLNEEILTHIGSQWDSLDPLREDWVSLATEAGLRERIDETLALEYDLTLPMGIKDPRLCRLFPLWLPALVERSLDVRVVIPFRNPLAVADSLGKRDGMPRPQALDLWTTYVGEALHHSHGLPRYFVDYDAFFSDPQEQLRQLAGFLDMTDAWESTLPTVLAFASADLRHHRFTEHIPNAAARRLYQDLTALADDQRSIAGSI